MKSKMVLAALLASLLLSGCANFKHTWKDGSETKLQTLFKKYNVRVQPTDPPTIEFSSGTDPVYINLPGYGTIGGNRGTANQQLQPQ